MTFPKSPTGTTGLQKQFAIEIRKQFSQGCHEIIQHIDAHPAILKESIAIKCALDPQTLAVIAGIMERIKFDLSPIATAFIGKAWWTANQNSAKTMGLGEWVPFDKRVVKSVQNRTYSYMQKDVLKKQDELKKVLEQGISQGDTIENIKNEVQQSFKTTSWKAETIARSNVIETYADSTKMAISNGGVTDEYQWKTSLKENVCIICRPLHNKVFKINDPRAPMPVKDTHPNCFIDRQIPILTIEGYKQIGDIKVGDLVLTKEGKYRKVTKLYFDKFYKKEVVSLYWKKYGALSNFLTVTPGHPIMTDTGYKKASNITIEDNIVVLAKRCKNCNKLIPDFYSSTNYCSKHCADSFTAKQQWEEKRELMLNAIKDNGGWNKGLTKETDLRVKNNGESIKKSWTKEWKKKHGKMMSIRMKQGQAANMCKCNRNPSKPQVALYNQVKNKFPDALLNEPFELYNDKHIVMDIAIPSLKICVEYDGSYWHQDKEKDLQRDLETKKKGWDTIRINEDNFNNWEEILQNLINNHDEKFEFMTIKLEKIEKWELKRNQRLYNFEVDEFHNYIAKGIVFKNCNCGIVPYVRF